jgi:hypothetical protein
MPRKEKKFNFIYKTTNTLNGRYYYGMHSTNNLKDGYLGSGRRLRYSVNKYGAENHQREILEYLDSREELANREREIVNLNEIAKVDCMNLKVGGRGGYFENNPEVTKVAAVNGQIGLRRKIKNDPEFSKRFSKIQSDKMSNLHKEGKVSRPDWTGKIHTADTKKKMSESSMGTQSGNKNSQFGTCWINNSIINKKINKKDLPSYLESKWIKGRKMNLNK